MRLLMLILTVLPGYLLAEPVQSTLDNGLKVIVKEDHRAPVAVSMIWYDVGSSDEPGGITGVSHALEHIMFKGTEQYPLGVFSKTIASLGGQENAFTSHDYTAYFEKIAADKLETSFKLEADRMQNLLLDPQEFKREIKVIQEERRMRTDDNPQGLTFERFLATAHLAAPYQHPVIGWMSDLEQMTINDVKSWYQRYYTPNNATLVVVGDVDPQSVFKLANRYFGAIQPVTHPPRKMQSEPPALGEKKVNVHAPAQLPMLMLGYTVPSVKTVEKEAADEPYALEIIAGLLDAGESSRFSKHLVRQQQMANAIDIYYNLYTKYQTQFMIYATPSEKHTLSELKAAILAELNRLQKQPVKSDELQRVKNQIIAQKTYEKDSIFGQAMELGLLETIGLGWETGNQYTTKINSITPEEVQKTAKRYFNAKSMTTARLIPGTLSNNP